MTSTHQDRETDTLSVTQTVPRPGGAPDQEMTWAQEQELLEGLRLPVPILKRRSGVYTRSRLVPVWPLVPDPLPVNPGRMDGADLAGEPGGETAYEEARAAYGAGYGAELTPNPDSPTPLPITPIPIPEGGPFPKIPIPQLPVQPTLPPFPRPPRLRLVIEELRVDVDGRAPTMTVSGTLRGGFLALRLTWIARVSRTAAGTYAGDITYRDGASWLLPQTRVEVALHPVLPIGDLSATATFSGAGRPTVTRSYSYARSFFREVNVEFDRTTDAPQVVEEYDTASHPNRPAGLPLEKLTLESTFGQMGIRIVRSAGGSTFDLTDAGTDQLWSNIELHDAMRHNWSRWADVAQWAMWVIFARQHEFGNGLGGIMFDDIGVAQRQGTAVFSDSFVAQAPAGDPAPAAWVQRMLFWTAVHEMGHAFNLAHSWQKSLGTGWVPLADEVEARSYMNYPYRVAAAPGSTPERTFFSDFMFRFSENELVFLRHAPERFVQMGNALWFDNHAVEELRQEMPSPLMLDLRIHRRPTFEFLEPVTVELKLKNLTASPIVLDKHILEARRLALGVTREGREPVMIRPYVNPCYLPEDIVLQPGESLYASATVSYDASGYAIDEPGRYTIGAVLDLDEGPVLSAPLEIRVARPYSREAEDLADEVFTRDVRAVLAVGGTRELSEVNDVLADVAERMPDSRIAMHANAVLGGVAAEPGWVFEDDSAGLVKARVSEPRADEAAERLTAAYGDLDAAAETFGHIDVTAQVVDAAESLSGLGDTARAGALVEDLANTLEQRNVKEEVVAAVRDEARRITR